jgi:hypothetical protein
MIPQFSHRLCSGAEADRAGHPKQKGVRSRWRAPRVPSAYAFTWN